LDKKESANPAHPLRRFADALAVVLAYKPW